MIKFENVSVTYPGGVEALKDLDLEKDTKVIKPLSSTLTTLAPKVNPDIP